MSNTECRNTATGKRGGAGTPQPSSRHRYSPQNARRHRHNPQNASREGTRVTAVLNEHSRNSQGGPIPEEKGGQTQTPDLETGGPTQQKGDATKSTEPGAVPVAAAPGDPRHLADGTQENTPELGKRRPATPTTMQPRPNTRRKLQTEQTAVVSSPPQVVAQPPTHDKPWGLLDAHDDKTASVQNGQGDPERLEAGTRPLRGQGEMGSGDDEQRNTEENQA